jgi:hypothetical protein
MSEFWAGFFTCAVIIGLAAVFGAGPTEAVAARVSHPVR